MRAWLVIGAIWLVGMAAWGYDSYRDQYKTGYRDAVRTLSAVDDCVKATTPQFKADELEPDHSVLRRHAIECFDEAHDFTNKPWSETLELAQLRDDDLREAGKVSMTEWRRRTYERERLEAALFALRPDDSSATELPPQAATPVGPAY